EGGDLVRLQLLPVVGEALVGEDAAVDARVEGLDPAVEHLGGSGDGRDVGDRDAGVPDGAAGGAGGDDLHAVRGEGAGQLDDARSEEHTSELQSRFDLVCRLLLEKKKR